jgi:hypothetical protein
MKLIPHDKHFVFQIEFITFFLKNILPDKKYFHITFLHFIFYQIKNMKDNSKI